MMNILLESITRDYRKSGKTIKALDRIDLEIKKGEFMVIRGPSGSGKTTLLLTIGGMLRPTSGRLLAGGKDLYAMNNRERTQFRAGRIGFVFQMFHLIPYLTVLENILVSAETLPGKSSGLKESTFRILQQMHLEDRAFHFPHELSAGEKQRAAIGRAMLNKPEILLADEPTGNLDPKNAGEAADLLSGFKSRGCTVLVVTHGQDCDPYADRIIQLDSGRIHRRQVPRR